MTRRTHAVPLSLAVQYAVNAPALPRWKLRRWVMHTLHHIQQTDPNAPWERAAFTLRLVDQEEGQQLNTDFRQKPSATNVLTFAYGVDDAGTLCADIVLCLPVLYNEAQAQGKTIAQHAAHLTVHGVLHALGYDHQTDAEASRMEALETCILARLGVPDPYAATMQADARQ